eukprot:736257-Rhodomonas_salina.2
MSTPKSPPSPTVCAPPSISRLVSSGESGLGVCGSEREKWRRTGRGSGVVVCRGKIRELRVVWCVQGKHKYERKLSPSHVSTHATSAALLSSLTARLCSAPIRSFPNAETGHFELIAGNSNPELAEQIAQNLG